MRVGVKTFLGLIAVLAPMPLLAQATGPAGYAEPKAPQTVQTYTVAPPKPTPDNIVNFQLSSGGIVSVQLRPDKAPLAVERIKVLTGRHFYDGLAFHRVIEGFMAQGGDPKGDGSGGSDLPDLKAEFNDLPHVRGAMAMARAQAPDSANSQFYIMLSPNLTLDMRYTIIGRVISGMGYADRIAKGEPPANPTKIVRAFIGAVPADAATPPTETAAPVAVPGAPASIAGDRPGSVPGTPAAPPSPSTKPPRRR